MPASTPPPQPNGPHATAAGAGGHHGLGELRGAANATAAMVPFVLIYGVIAFGARGVDAAQVGLGASLLSVVLGGVLLALLSNARMAAASPSASSCLILGTSVAAWMRDPALAAPGGLADILALAGLTVFLAGVFGVLLGLGRAGSLVAFVPRPVLAGFMNGVAVLIVLSQLPALLGLAPDALARMDWSAWAEASPLAAGLATLTGLLMLALRRHAPRAPAALLALVLACLALAALKGAWLWWRGEPMPRVDHFGPLQPMWAGMAMPGLWSDAGVQLLQRHGLSVLGSAAVLALIGSLESVLNMAAVDQQLRQRSDPNRLLVSLGLTNAALGLLGGLPVVQLRLRALATWQGGGVGRWAMWGGSAMLALVFLLAAPWGEWIAWPVVAGIVVVLAWTLVDGWSLGLVRKGLARWGSGESNLPSAPEQDRLISLGVMAAVCGFTVAWGFVPGVALGLLLSLVLLVRTLHRSLIRMRSDGTALPSRRSYPPAHAAWLAGRRAAIDIVELEGALFFGNVERLRTAVERQPATMRCQRRCLVIDFRRVTAIDASAAVMLGSLRDELARAGVALLLAGVTADNRHGQVLLAHDAQDGPDPASSTHAEQGIWRLYADTDHATEAAERALLAESELPAVADPVPLRASMLMQGLDAALAAHVASCMTVCTLQPGERLFAQGDPGDALYVLESGSLTVREAHTGQRFLSLSPGMMLGETALLDGGGRTAEAVADGPTEPGGPGGATLHRLSADQLSRLQLASPEAAAAVYLNVARHLSERLRGASVAWLRAAE